MTIQERRTLLIERISNIKDEQTIQMLEADLQYYTDNNSADITDELTAKQLKELLSIAGEPSDQDVISESDFKSATAKWRTK